ncbi:MAG: hypothetical protein JXR48_09150 [Candidatus Delongbacteria bacterium]|nr:hypothetical protein [Candidatus Delongbacteria bacterium]MBN2835118.1 hypothetical protein [Candidatus Delongbacteria bacterium]
MPQVIQFIDEIGREKQRAVLYIEFYPKPESDIVDSYETYEKLEKQVYEFDYRKSKNRQFVIDWLDENKIPYYECGRFSKFGGFIKLHEKYLGNLYIDIPFDRENPDYMKLEEFLENPDGTFKFKNVRFCYVALEVAMEYGDGDEDEFD